VGGTDTHAGTHAGAVGLRGQVLRMQQAAACAWPRVHLGSHWGAYADEDPAHDMFDALLQVCLVVQVNSRTHVPIE
jgi:hypothetical protein